MREITTFFSFGHTPAYDDEAPLQWKRAELISAASIFTQHCFRFFGHIIIYFVWAEEKERYHNI